MINNNYDSEKLTLQRRAIQKISLLPSIPATLQKIILTSNDPHSSAEDMQKIIEKDQSISAAILKLANSAYFGYTRQIHEIKQAIIIIGFNTAVSVAVSVSVLKSLADKFDSPEFSRDDFWKHTIATGEAARIVAHTIGFEPSAKAYITGLLHDVGKIVLLLVDSKEFNDAVFESHAMNKPLNICEMQAFGFDHQSAGGWLGNRWKLPDSIVSGLLYHHDLDSCPEEFLQEATITHLANYVCIKAHIGNSGDIADQKLHENVKIVLKINNKMIDQILGELEKKKDEIDAFFEILL
ncbi:HDOD domain-containing protein [candidate division KSB1 bacterium]